MIPAYLDLLLLHCRSPTYQHLPHLAPSRTITPSTSSSATKPYPYRYLSPRARPTSPLSHCPWSQANPYGVFSDSDAGATFLPARLGKTGSNGSTISLSHVVGGVERRVGNVVAWRSFFFFNGQRSFLVCISHVASAL